MIVDSERVLTGDLIAAQARLWIGTPWHHQASLRGVGCDCIGLVAGVAGAVGLPEAEQWRQDMRFQGYGRLPEPAKLLRACALYLDRVNIARKGDVLLMAFFDQPMHFGILSSEVPRRMVHAYEPRGRVIEQIIDAKWHARQVAVFRLRGVA